MWKGDVCCGTSVDKLPERAVERIEPLDSGHSKHVLVVAVGRQALN